MISKQCSEEMLFVRLFWIIILISFLAWLFGLLIDPQGPQLNLFYFRMNNFWADATNVTDLIKDRTPYFSEERGSYPPLAYLLFYPLALVSENPVIVYRIGKPYCLYYYQPLWTMLFVIGLLITLIFIYTVCVRQLKNCSKTDAMMTGIVLCFTYPVLYAVERGNILLITVVFLSVFVFYYDNECWWKREIALVSLAIASGIKLSPAIFGILLILNRDWKAVFRSISYGLFFLLVPFFFFEKGLSNFPQMMSNINYFITVYVGNSNFEGTGIFASYLKFAKVIFGGGYWYSKNTYLILNLTKYIISLILFLGTFQLKEKWKIVLNITLILLILPKISLLYCVLYMIPFTVLFLGSLSKEKMVIDKVLILAALIMFYFVYRCPISEFFDYTFAIPLLIFIGLGYSIRAIIKSRHILPVNF